jgi:hypothetical protein
MASHLTTSIALPDRKADIRMLDATRRRTSNDSIKTASDDTDPLTPATSTSGGSTSPIAPGESTPKQIMAKDVTPSRPSRQSWSPLFPSFMVSAPGKVIVYGEHAVVHGKVHSCEYSLSNSDIHPGSNRSSHIPSFIPPRLFPLQDGQNRHLALSRHPARLLLEH